MGSQQNTLHSHRRFPGCFNEFQRQLRTNLHLMGTRLHLRRLRLKTPPRDLYEGTLPEFFTPILLALLRFLCSPLQSHKVAEFCDGRSELDWSRFTAQERCVVEEDFGEHRSHAPAIKHSVMKTENEIKRVIRAKKNVRSYQRSLSPIKIPALLLLLPGRQ